MKRILSLLILLAMSAMAQDKADQVIVSKKDRKLELLYQGKVIRTYHVALGGSPVGHKTQQGDQKTPEGDYVIDFRNPRSQFHKSMHISYPNASDRAQARQRGVSPGGDIFIHGGSPENNVRDWTWGCIAVTNAEIDEIWKLVPNGTPIAIKP